MDRFVIATTTTPTRDLAQRIAAALIERRLAACAQVGADIRSWYRWEDRLEQSAEVLILIKTREDLVPAIAELLKEMHPYEVPELVAAPIVTGAPAYLHWMAEVLRR